MYYSLKPEYLLRGWEGMAWVLVRRPENQIMTLSREMFQTLLLCDGETELSASSLDDETLGALREAEEKGFIQPCENPQPLAEDQYYQYYKNRYVSKVFWSVTGRCNFRCRHCYMDAPDGMLGELSTEEALEMIDQMAECGVLRVDITGGEPLVRKDIWQLIDRILSHHMVIRNFHTNGWLLDGDQQDPSSSSLFNLLQKEKQRQADWKFEGIQIQTPSGSKRRRINRNRAAGFETQSFQTGGLVLIETPKYFFQNRRSIRSIPERQERGKRLKKPCRIFSSK